jgi:hypothetical protein
LYSIIGFLLIAKFVIYVVKNRFGMGLEYGTEDLIFTYVAHGKEFVSSSKIFEKN